MPTIVQVEYFAGLPSCTGRLYEMKTAAIYCESSGSNILLECMYVEESACAVPYF